ncbi:conserved protein of unknown function [Candidatus Filomicrobium marinum]|uniref:Uncharacterized protein n=2 Tax=Filomicrobium TaxID=119044 RepID=A0A0D6JF98_9HYPH|nr:MULTISPECIES: Na+/H+ antiporter subunit E [Filomicrobium]MCV0370161.1 Na+/H+ antiporter subunit E [Filomicrobium sp.]CFX25330.1 conserved protein of unknown function [Candidatus Filomicrobium marinum]CPR19282.1 conserved protein of unknown function [Candidatus Filomicrobium marinum]SDO09496.1 multisubunit sodium/proton antiporter, MrpE subunit [Filomicrobium insigne]
MQDKSDGLSETLRSGSVRAALFFILWLIITGAATGDMLIGVIASLIAAVASLKLLPPRRRAWRLSEAVKLGVRFLRQSIVAGIDVARRTLDPLLPLRPGFVSYKSKLPRGPERDAFFTMTSLLPGTLPSGPGRGEDVLVHCLDVEQPVAEQLAIEEHLFHQVAGGVNRDE